MRSLVLHPDPLLRQRSTELPPRDEWPALAEELIQAMNHYRGAGLSAIQLGLPFRCFAMQTLGGDRCFFSPRILSTRDDGITEVEECLSLPGVRVRVTRAWTVTAEVFLPDGERRVFGFNAWKARVFQHELDHLSGRLIIDHGEPIPEAAA